MISFIWDMLATPGAPGDAYGWAAVGLAHMGLSAALVGIVAGIGGLARSRSTTLATDAAVLGSYFWVTWELAQLAFFAAPFPDMAADLAFELGGAWLAWAAWRHRVKIIVTLLAGLAILTLGGVRRRK